MSETEKKPAPATAAFRISELSADRGAEAAVLGSMMIDPRRIPDVLAKLPDKEAFWFSEHPPIFDAICHLFLKNVGEALDGLLVRAELERRGQLEDIGGAEYLQRVIETVPSSASVMYYVDILRDKQAYRELVKVHSELGEDLLVGGEASGLVQKTQERVMGLEVQTDKPYIFHAKDHAQRVALAIRDKKPVVHTGFANVDRLYNGACAGDLVLIGARPSMGKTSFAINWAINAGKKGKRVVIFSLEMTPDAIIERACAMLGRVSLQQIQCQNPEPSDEMWLRFCAGSCEFEKLPVTTIQRTEHQATPEWLRMVIRRLKKTRPVDLLVVDYIQLMDADLSKNASTYERVSTISKGLKGLAQSENIPVVALAQLNRAPEGRENHRPRLSDLRDSGGLEQDADVVMFLHREDYYRKHGDADPKQLDDSCEVIIAKSRNGATGMATLWFYDDEMRFEDANFTAQEP